MRLVLVHGSGSAGEAAWTAQLPLRDRFELVIPSRSGYPPNPPLEGIDFEEQAGEIAELLEPGDHLAGHSYGGVVSLLAAARRPEVVRSLTVTEPPAFGVAAGRPVVDELVERLQTLWEAGPSEPEAFLRAFLQIVGSDFTPPSPLPPELEAGTRATMAERGPWEAEIPLDLLASAPFPKLVISGGHHRAFDAVCDVLEARLDAQRAVLPGAGHSIPRLGPPYNDLLAAFVQRAEQRG